MGFRLPEAHCKLHITPRPLLRSRNPKPAFRNPSTQGKFLASDLKYGATSSALGNADKLSKIQPFPSATIANSRKKPLLQGVSCEPGPIDAIEKRMSAVFGRTGKQ